MNLKELKLKIMNEMIRLRNEGLVEQDCVMDVLEDTIDPFVEERERQEKCDDAHLQRIADLEKENTRLKAQNEKMKCCGNCEHYKPVVLVNESISNMCEDYYNGCNNNIYEPYNKWELKEKRQCKNY